MLALQQLQKIRRHKKFIACVELITPLVLIAGSNSLEAVSKEAIFSPTFLPSADIIGFAGLCLSCLCILTNTFSKQNSFHQSDTEAKTILTTILDKWFYSKYSSDCNKALLALKDKNFSDLNLSEEKLELLSSYLISKFLSLSGINKNDAYGAFFSKNEDYLKEKINLFYELDEAVDLHFTSELKKLEPRVLQVLFDTTLEASDLPVGARFHLIHQHHSKNFYEVLEKITFRFDKYDTDAASEFLTLLKESSEDPDSLNSHYWGTHQYLSYGVLLNEGFIEHLLIQEDIPTEILDYFIACNQGLGISEHVIERIQLLKTTKECRDILDQALPRTPIPQPDINHTETVNSDTIIEWDNDRILTLPLNAPPQNKVFKL